MAATAATVLVAACEDLPLGTQTLPLSDLLVLPLQSSATPPAERSFYVSNGRITVERLTHTDGFNNLHFGVATACRGWATVADIANTRPWAEIEAMLKRAKS